MARSESQGLQIAVILLTMCVVGLAISTWVYYQAADTSLKLKQTADSNAKAADDRLKKEVAKLAVYKYIVGDNTVTEKDAEAIKGMGGDATAEGFLKTYKTIASGEAEKAATPEAKGALALPTYLTGGIAARNKQLGEAAIRETKLNNDIVVIDKRETGRTAEAEKGMQTAVADLAKERDAFNNDRAQFKKDLDDLKATIAQRDKQLKELKEKADKEISDSRIQVANLEKDIENLRLKLANTSKVGPSFEAPDGQITWVNQRTRICYIDVGSGDGLTRQTTFSVYDHDENGVSSAKPKARIEVIRVTEPHLAECRIVEDEIKNPLLPGDKIFTPAWSPGQHLHFAINGGLDIDGDGRQDNDEVRAIIELNGGIVDSELKPNGEITGEITIQTRYLIRGKAPSDKDYTGDDAKKAFDNWSTMTGKAEKFGVEIIDITRFLNMMGWKAQERTTGLGGKKTASKRGAAESVKKSPAAEEAAGELKKSGKSKPDPTEKAADDEDPFGK